MALVYQLSQYFHLTFFFLLLTGIWTDFQQFCSHSWVIMYRSNAFLPSFCHFCACEMLPWWGHLITWMDPSVGHLNGILARVGGNLNNNFKKSQMPGGGGGASIWPIHNERLKDFKSFTGLKKTWTPACPFSKQNLDWAYLGPILACLW